MKGLVALLSAVGLALFLMVLGVHAQDAEDQTFDFSLSDAFVRALAQQNTILFKMPLLLESRSKVHALGNDCEMRTRLRRIRARLMPERDLATTRWGPEFFPRIFFFQRSRDSV